MRTRTMLLVLAGGLLAAAAGCQSPADRLNQQGLAAYDVGDYDTALAAFHEAMEANPEKADYYYNAGAAYQALGEPEPAVIHYRMAVNLDPSLVDAFARMARCHLDQGRSDQALAALELGASSNPYTAAAFINVARLYLGRDDLGMAKLWLAKAVAAEPSSARANRLYGEILVRTGESDRGREYIRRGLALEAGQPDVPEAPPATAPAASP